MSEPSVQEEIRAAERERLLEKALVKEKLIMPTQIVARGKSIELWLSGESQLGNQLSYSNLKIQGIVTEEECPLPMSISCPSLFSFSNF